MYILNYLHSHTYIHTYIHTHTHTHTHTHIHTQHTNDILVAPDIFLPFIDDGGLLRPLT